MAELDSQPKSIQSIYSWYSEGRLSVNRRYQRKLVWTQEEKQRLVESVLRKYPVPAVLLAETETGEYEIIDGLQRLHTLVSFIENGFPTLAGEYFDASQFPTANARADDGVFDAKKDGVVSPREVSTFLDYSLAISIMRGAGESEIDDVFGRINTYGHQLSDQERRQAGVQDEFSNLVRELACEVRGDASSDVLKLEQMPSISIDLPMSNHGYEVVADQVFWVEQGILRSTDLRDSMDEQCVADIAGSIVGGSLLGRSKEALDAIYQSGSSENQRIADALDSYGSAKFSDEFKYCVDQVKAICAADPPKKLRNVIFDKPSTNAFPAVFAVIMIALQEALIADKKKISNHLGAREALTGVYARLDTSRKSTASDERRKNVDTIKGLISKHLVPAEHKNIYGSHASTDIDVALRRSEIELPNYELKQGLLRLDHTREIDPGVMEKIAKTVCAMANNGKERTGTILIGVTDKDAHAERVQELDGISPKRVGRRYVVGVKREADFLGQSLEDYYARWKHAIRNSEISEPLKSDVLSSMDFNDYFGMGVIAISVPPQTDLSFFGDDVYWRDGDETVAAVGAKKIADLQKRFT